MECTNELAWPGSEACISHKIIYHQIHTYRLSDDHQKGLRLVIAHSEEGDIVADCIPKLIQTLLTRRDKIFQFIGVKVIMETLLNRQQLDGLTTARGVPPSRAT